MCFIKNVSVGRKLYVVFGPFPALLDIHGGAWNNGDRTNNPALAEGLAASGVVVVSIDFRCGGTYPYPSSLADINYATRWLKVHAADFNADAATAGGLGVSSGGHLILLSAMRPFDPRYTALPLAGALTVLIWLAEAGHLFFVVHGLGLDLRASGVIFIAVAASILTAVPLTPAGFGFVEIAMVVLLTQVFGFAQHDAVAVAVVDRSVSVFSLLVVGGILYVREQRSLRHTSKR